MKESKFDERRKNAVMDFRSKEECKVGGLVYAGKILEATAAYDCDEIKNAFFSFRNDFLRVFLICV